jgi:CsoR family transcriptional regulator, copper-sensing transcriptional repressor
MATAAAGGLTKGSTPLGTRKPTTDSRPAPEHAPGYAEAQDAPRVMARLRRVEGQVRGIQRMVAEERYCVDVLAQISACTSALEKVGLLLLNDHIRHCVRGSIVDGGGDDKIEELVTAVDRFVRAT